MINFRFHVVSIVAVFLAIAIGVVFGSTIVDQAIVDGIKDDLRNTERRVEETNDQNEALKDDVDRFGRYFESMAPYVVEDRLADDAVVIVAERGLEPDVVDHQRELLVDAGVAPVVVVWLESTLDVDPSTVGELAAIAGTVSDDPAAVRAAAFAALAASLGEFAATADGSGAPPSTVPSGAPDVVQAFVDAGYVAVDGDVSAFRAISRVSRRAVVLGSTDSELARLDALGEVAAAFDAATIETVAGEVWVRPAEGVDPSDRGARLHAITSGDRSERIATVDNVDEVQGRISVVIALEEVIGGIVGHYGFGSGATRSTPEWTGA